MTINEVLHTARHRPWTMPASQWKYYQEWNKAVFLHWQVNLSELRKDVPEHLEIDLCEGKPWVSLVAFTMNNIRPRILPPFPPISDFDEINVRTYVKRGNKTGVYFLSVEGGSYLSCKVARALSHLPYRYSKMKREANVYTSANRQFNDQMHLSYEVGEMLTEKTDLDLWLTERYALFQDSGASINEFEIHHIEWPTYNIELKEVEIDYPRFKSYLNNSPDRAHYSTGVQVVAWDRKRIVG